MAQKKVDVAIKAIEKTLEINSQDAFALNNLAFIYLAHKNDPRQAFTYIQAAEKIKPTNALILANKADIESALRREEGP